MNCFLKCSPHRTAYTLNIYLHCNEKKKRGRRKFQLIVIRGFYLSLNNINGKISSLFWALVFLYEQFSNTKPTLLRGRLLEINCNFICDTQSCTLCHFGLIIPYSNNLLNICVSESMIPTYVFVCF